MCGICGIRTFGDKPIPRVMFDLMLVDNQRRGSQATGVAIQHRDGKIFVHKSDVPAWNLVTSHAYKEFMSEHLTDEAITVLGHCRWATKGPPDVNNNNHPMWGGTTALIHNGHISNDDDLFKELKLKRKAETDSDILRAIIDEHGFTAKAISTLSKCWGSAAIAAVSTDFPGELFLARSGNPLQIAGTRDFLLFSSERGTIKKAYRPVIKKFGVLMRHQGVDLAVGEVNNDSAWIFGDKPRDSKQGWKANWLRYHQEMRIATHFTPRNYEPQKAFFGLRLKHYDLTRADVVQCPKCKDWVLLKEEQAFNIRGLRCVKCGSRLVADK